MQFARLRGVASVFEPYNGSPSLFFFPGVMANEFFFVLSSSCEQTQASKRRKTSYVLPIFFKAVVVIKTLTRSHTEVQKRENRVSVWHSELPVAAFNVYLAPLVWNVICGEHGFSRWVSLRFECINMFGAKTEVRNGKLWNQKWSLTIDWNQPRVNYMESVKLLSINNSQHFKPYLIY